MITRLALETAGYREFPNPMSRDAWDAKMFQKRFVDDNGTRYFINVGEYVWSQFSYVRSGPRFSYEPDVHLYTGNGDSLFRMVVQDEAALASVEALEIFVENIWTKLGAGYYETY